MAFASNTADSYATLPLVEGSKPVRHSFLTTLHFVLFFLAVTVKLPFHLLYHYVFLRHRSPLVQIVGRHPVAEAINHVAKCIFLDAALAPSRAVFATQLFLRGDKWVEKITTKKGVKGIWICPPGSDRKEDQLVLYWVHGGAFNHDIIGSNLPFYKNLVLELNKHQATPIHFSLFVLDYQLAPEKVYPSQLIELQAGYEYLTKTVGVDSSRICIGGDSAGGNLVASFLLHLVKPNEKLPIPSTPLANPGSVLLLSPWTSLLPLDSRLSRSSYSHSVADFLTTPGVTSGAYHYLGLEPPFASGASWNPLKWFGLVQDDMPGLEDEDEVQGLFNDPYISPGPEIVRKANWEWYERAFPKGGRTCVVWGGMEVFADDVKALVQALKTVGVSPVELYVPLKGHDWPLFDFTFPFLSRTKNAGPSSRFDYGSKKMAEFLRSVADGESE